MIAADRVSCCLVTRGNVDLTPILETLPFNDIVVWDNSKRYDLGIYGRYAAIAEAKNDVIVTQDDDLIVTCWPDILEAYEPGALTVNYPEPWDVPWVARGAIFDRNLPRRAFNTYLKDYPRDRFFTHKACDAVFCLLAEHVNVIDRGSVDLDYCNAAGRVSTSSGWYDRDRPEAQRRCKAILERR